RHTRFSRDWSSDVCSSDLYLRQRPDDQPFCLCYHFKAPHGPWEPDARFYDAFQDVEIPIPVAFEQGPPEGAPEALSKTRMSVAEIGRASGREGARSERVAG